MKSDNAQSLAAQIERGYVASREPPTWTPGYVALMSRETRQCCWRNAEG